MVEWFYIFRGPVLAKLSTTINCNLIYHSDIAVAVAVVFENSLILSCDYGIFTIIERQKRDCFRYSLLEKYHIGIFHIPVALKQNGQTQMYCYFEAGVRILFSLSYYLEVSSYKRLVYDCFDFDCFKLFFFPATFTVCNVCLWILVVILCNIHFQSHPYPSTLQL